VRYVKMLDTLKLLRKGWAGGGLKFFLDFGILSGGHVTIKIIGFFVFAFLARTLYAEGYGAVEYVVGLSVFFATLVDCGLGAVGVRRIARQPGDLPVLAAQVPLARLGLALISVPLMALVAAPATQEPAVRGLVWLFAFSLLAAPWRQDWLLQATERMSEAMVAQLLRVIIFGLFVLWLVRDPTDILAVGWAEIAAVSMMSLYCVALQQAKIAPFRLRAPVAGFAGLAREGAVVGFGNAVWAANQYAPLLLVASLGGGMETAWFAAANRMVASVLTFSHLYHFNLYPAIARATMKDRDELTSVLAASFRVVAWGGILVALALTLVAQPLCVLLFGAKFGPSAAMLMVMAWVVPITLLSGHARWSLVAAGIQSRVVYAQIAGLSAIGIVGIPLVLSLGGRGAALVSVVASAAVWLAAHVFSGRHGGRPPAFTLALAPGGLALVVIGGSRMLGLDSWSAGFGVIVFAAAAPLLDRKLLPDLWRLGATRLEKSALPEPIV
jgi:O-antigen/teichoic acid export membrane protein